MRLKRCTATAAPQEDDSLAQQRRDVLRDAIVDIQGSVRANDSKCSAALVVHGLLFAGVLTITREVGPVYETASFWQRGAIIFLLAAGLVSFLISVWELSRAASPYEPTELSTKIAGRHEQIFFPSVELLVRERKGCADEFGVYTAKIKNLSSAQIEEDYAAEVLKLSDIRKHQAGQARRGYFWLRGVLIAVAAYLVVVAIIALSHLGG